MVDAPKYEIITGDCITELRKIKETGVLFDAIVADPPYCSGGYTPAMVARKGGDASKYSQATDVLGTFGDGMTQEAFWFFSREWLRATREVMKPLSYAFVFIDWRQLPTFANAFQAAGFIWRGVAVWDKGNCRPNQGHISQTAEFICWGTKGSVKSDKYMTDGVISIAAPPFPDRIHPTQKSWEVIEKLLRVLPDDAERILDPFNGSGSTGIAALSRGLDYVGIEENETFAERSRGRLEETKKSIELTGVCIDKHRKQDVGLFV